MPFSISDLLDPEVMRDHNKVVNRMRRRSPIKKKDVMDLVADIQLHKINNLQKQSKLPQWGKEPNE